MPDPTPQRAGWPILFGAIVVGVSAALGLALMWGVSVVNVLVFFAVVAALVGVNCVVLSLTDRRRRP